MTTPRMKLFVVATMLGGAIGFAPHSFQHPTRAYDVSLDAEKGSKRKAVLKVRDLYRVQPNAALYVETSNQTLCIILVLRLTSC